MYKVEYSHEDTQGHDTLIVGGAQHPHKLETNKNILRLYNHPLCPFAEKARLAFLAKNIKHQIVDVDASEKPDWFVEQGGAVPILETTDGDLIPESDVLVDFAIDYSQDGINLLPGDPIQVAKLKLYTKKRSDGFIMPLYMSFLKGEAKDLDKLKEFLRPFEQDLAANSEGNKYLFNQSDVTFADIQLSPFLARVIFTLEEKLDTVSSLKLEDYPNIHKYVDNIIHHPVLERGYTPKFGFLNFIILKQKDLSIKLPIPFDTTPFEDSQSQKVLYIRDGHTSKPRINQKFLRLYGHHLCPFVQRAMLVLTAKQIPYQFVAIDLTHKNKWHLDINNGFVPILEQPDGTIVHDSLDVCDWLQDHTKDGVDLYPGDAEHKQKLKDLVKEICDKITSFIAIACIKDIRDNYSGDKFAETVEWFDSYLPDSETNIYINGQEHETMADLMVLPFIHCAFLYKDTQLKEKLYDSLDLEKIKKTKHWYDALYSKYGKDLSEGSWLSNWLNKNIEANGPKIQLSYPLTDN